MSVGLRPLSLSLAPGDDEALDSYVERLAWHNRCSVATVLHRTGLARSSRYEDFPSGYWVALDDKRVRTFAATARIERSAVRSMLMTTLNETCLRLDRYASGSEPLRETALREWAYFSSSHVCPRCLAESFVATSSRGWKLAWRLPWTIICPKHNCLLVDTCPRCGARVRGGTRRANTGFASSILPPGICRNSWRPAAGSAAELCGHELAQSDVVHLGDESTIHGVQRIINAQLQHDAATAQARVGTAFSWFQDLRTICALILSAAEPEDLTSDHPAIAAAFGAYVAERRHRDQLRIKKKLNGDLRGGAPRLRPYTTVPQQATLMATLLVTAVPVLETESSAQRRQQVGWLIDRLRARNPKGVSQLERLYPMSSDLAGSLQPLTKVYVPAALESMRGRVREAHRFTAAHVPQLLWDQLFAQEFEYLLPGTKRDFARRFCSLAILRLRDGCTWQEGAKLLDLPDTTVSLAVECTGRLTRADQQAEFTLAVKRAARLIDQRPLIDYASRRALLNDLTDIPSNEWSGICTAAGVPVGRAEGRRYAAAWLWCYLTEGDYRLAPALSTPPSRNNGQPLITRYTRWVKQENRVTRLSPQLAGYGHTLLASRATPTRLVA